MNTHSLLLPSILSAPLNRLGEALRELENAGATLFHFDVMDGHFVPNLTLGPLVIESLQGHIRSAFDVHLMVTNPEEQITWFDLPSVRSLTIHIEASSDIIRDLRGIRERGKLAGISLNPPTPVSEIEPVLEEVDQVLVMSVHPGFAGQEFMEDALPKIETLAKRKAKSGLPYAIQVDGGINLETIRLVSTAGAEEIIAGNAIFAAENPVAAYQELREIMWESSD